MLDTAGLSREGDLIAAALRGERPAIASLVDLLTPVVQARVARLLLRRGKASGRDVSRDVEDLSQEVFLSLFDDDGRLLRSWDPARGLSLANWVGMIAHRQVISLLRSGKTSPFAEDPTAEDDLAALAGGDDLEAQVASREELQALLDGVRLALSPKALELFHRMMVIDEPVATIAATTGLSANALYTWRSRFGRLARQLLGRPKPGGQEKRQTDPRGRMRTSGRGT